MAGQPFPQNPELIGVVNAYKNGTLIADQVLPRLMPYVSSEKFLWWLFDFAQFLTVPDSKVGRKGQPNVVEIQAQEKTDRTEDHGFDASIPLADINNAPKGYDPRSAHAQWLIDLVELAREARVAAMVFNAGNYGAQNKEQLIGSSKWSHVDSKPIIQFAQAADKLIVRPKHAVLGRLAWTSLRTNPSMLKSLTPSGVTEGMAELRAVADKLELDDIYVGEARLNFAHPGQQPQLLRAWGNHCLLFHKAPGANSQIATPTFGWTAQYGPRVAGNWFDEKIGLRGGEWVRSGESVKEVIAAPDLGYFFENVI
ncbi:capsid protein [Agrobacterium tumefaciens]|nr:capsid protein [Agrobacterium tumefaciens]